MIRLKHIFAIALFCFLSFSKAQENPHTMDFKYKIHHIDSVNTDFYLKLDLNTYLPKVINNSKYVKIGLSVSLTNNKTGKNFRSSREFNLDLSEHDKGIFTDSFNLQMESAEYDLEVLISDLNKNVSKDEFRSFKKNEEVIIENFLFRNSDGSVVYYKETPQSDELTGYCSNLRSDSLEIRYYSSIQSIALPPFLAKRNYPDFGNTDTILNIKVEEAEFKLRNINRKTLFISFEDDIERKGFLISRYPNFYPQVKTVDLLVEPLRYICSRNEYTILNDKNKHRRKEFENFWLDKSDNDREDARSLIRTYYSRVEHANTYFSTYKEGWKTDRGMIYIVFGPPDEIKDEGGKEERWIYTSRSGSSSMSFSFLREEGDFVENDYALVRNPIFRAQFNDAVTSWRSGVPYRQ